MQTPEMEKIRLSINESEQELKSAMDRTFADPMANDPEKKIAMALWLFKKTDAVNGCYVYGSVTQVINAVKAAKWQDDGIIAFGSEGKPIFSNGVSPISIGDWIDDYQKFGLDVCLANRRTGSRVSRPKHNYSVEEIAAEIAKPANKKIKGHLTLLKNLVESDFRLSANEIESVKGISSYTAGVRIIKIAAERSTDGATVEALSLRLLKILQQQAATKDLSAKSISYQFRVPPSVHDDIVKAAESMGLKKAAFFRKCADSYLKLSTRQRASADSEVAEWLDSQNDGETVLGGTVRLENAPANALEALRGDRSDSELMQLVVGYTLLTHAEKQEAA
jgi:hypothetical protein